MKLGVAFLILMPLLIVSVMAHPPRQIPEFPIIGGVAIPLGFASLAYIFIRRRKK